MRVPKILEHSGFVLESEKDFGYGIYRWYFHHIDTDYSGFVERSERHDGKIYYSVVFNYVYFKKYKVRYANGGEGPNGYVWGNGQGYKRIMSQSIPLEEIEPQLNIQHNKVIDVSPKWFFKEKEEDSPWDGAVVVECCSNKGLVEIK
jgi:hypothetical protein